MMSKKKNSRKKMLVFNVNWLGDVIFSSPFIRAIREASPDSYIACVVPPRCREIIETNSRINEVIVFDEDGTESSFLGKIRFALRLRKEHFDIVFLLHRSFTRALMMFIAGIEIRVGYDTKRRGFLLTKRLNLPKDMHRVEYFLQLARAVGADISKKDYEFFIIEPERRRASHILGAEGIDSNNRFVVINPGGNWDPKRWPVDRFAELSDRLIERYGVKVLITGAEKDKVLADEIANRMKNKVTSLCGKTNIKEIASILEKAELVVSGDSGPMHLAVSTGTNVIALFGPTSSHITGPYGSGRYTIIKKDVGCNVPCYDSSCRDNRCMKAISVDDVMSVIEEKGYIE